MKTIRHDEIAAIAEEYGIKVKAVFVPQTFTEKTPTLDMGRKWKVEINGGGRKIDSEFTQGVGHCPSYKQRLTVHDKQQLVRECAELDPKLDKNTAEIVALEALWSVCSDCLGVMNVRDFEDWAIDLGLSTDSRSAEAVYRKCLDTYQLMRGCFGDSAIETIAAVEL
jgi:hypothetical protein